MNSLAEPFSIRPEALEDSDKFKDREAIDEQESKFMDDHRQRGEGLFHAFW